MKCTVCGSELETGARVCKYCGNEIDYASGLDSYDKHDIDKDEPYEKISDNFGEDDFDKNASVRPKPDIDRSADETEGVRERNVKYCMYCGRTLDMTTGSCRFCGEREQAYRRPNLVYNEEKDMAQRYNNRPNTRQTGKKKKSNPVKNALIITLVMIILFAVSFIIFFRMLGGSFSEESATETPEITQTVSPTAQPTSSPSPAPKATEKTSSAIKTKETPTPQKTAQPEKTPDNSGSAAQSSGRNGYIYPSDEHIITEDELETLSRRDIKLIYWEMYARHGYTFDYDDLIEYFEAKNWYIPTTTDSAAVEAEFNSIERENKRIIEDYQREKGWRT